MQAAESGELRPDSAAKSSTVSPNAVAGAVQGKKRASLKELPQQQKQQQQKKKRKHGDDNKQEGAKDAPSCSRPSSPSDASEAIKSPRTSTKGIVRLRSPRPSIQIPIERTPQTTDPAGPEDGKQANQPVEAKAANKPSFRKKPAPSKLAKDTVGRENEEAYLINESSETCVPRPSILKQGKTDVGPAAPGETSEVWMPSSEIRGVSPEKRRKSSVRFGATTLQSISAKSLSWTSEDIRSWRALVIVGFIIIVLSLSIAVPIYVLRSRKRAMTHCASVECQLAVEDLMSLMDAQINPCDNFHQHVCGRVGYKTFGGASLTAIALDDLLIFAQRLLLNRGNSDLNEHQGIVQLATTFSKCYVFATFPNPLDEASIAEAIRNDTDILAVADVVAVLQRVVRLSLHRGISTLFKAGVVTYNGDVALYVWRGKSLSEKLAKRADDMSMQGFVLRLFESAFMNTTMVRRLDPNATVMSLLEFDNSLYPASRYATDEELAGNAKNDFMNQYIGGRSWLGFVNSLLPTKSHLTESSPVLVSEAEMVKKPVDELRKDINLGAIYVLLHVAAEIGRFYTIPLGQVTKACLQITQEILPPAMSNVFNNVTARAASQPSKADGVFLTVRNALAKHPLKQGMSEEDKSSAVYFLNHLNLHVRRTALGIWPNGSGWRPNEASNASSTAFPRFHGVLKVREAMRRLTDPPSVEEMAIERDLLASDAAYSPLLQEIFLPPSLRRAPVLYSGDVPVEFNMGTVGVLVGMQLVRASAPSPNGSHEWYDKNVGAFGRCAKKSKTKVIASQVDALPQDRLPELFSRTYSLRIAHRAVSGYYDGYRDASNFKAVWKEAQRILFRRFCLVSCGDSGRANKSDGSSQLDCLVPVLSMAEFYEAFECAAVEAGGMEGCASLT